MSLEKKGMSSVDKYLSFDQVKDIAHSQPNQMVGVNTYQILSQFNMVCGNEKKIEQTETLHKYLKLNKKKEKKRQKFYIPVSAVDAVVCFDTMPHKLPGNTFRRIQVTIEEPEKKETRKKQIAGNSVLQVKTAEA